MDYGVLLPLIDFDGEPFTLDRLPTYTECLGYSAISVTNRPRVLA
jgi:hypothetical protein